MLPDTYRQPCELASLPTPLSLASKGRALTPRGISLSLPPTSLFLAVLNSLRQLSTSTSILTDPGCIAEQATRAVTEGTPGKLL